VSEPLLLDLYCCAGGAAVGYAAAGWRVVGVDIAPQPDYPHEFHRGDAIEFAKENGHEFTAVHASPPCQGEGGLAKGTSPELADRHPHLIGPTRDVLDAVGLPYVIENVTGSDIRRDVTLCGEMFGLGVIMHRHFELGGWSAEGPEHRPHRGYVRGWRHGVWRDGPYVAAYGRGGGKATAAEMREAKRIDWTSDHQALREALPPAYTEWVGARLLDHVRNGSS
jgi:hypothetical protein